MWVDQSPLGHALNVRAAEPVVDLCVDLPEPLQALAKQVGAEVRTALDTSPYHRVGVAYSGGVDSSVLAALVARAVGRERTLLLLGESASLARRERTFAMRQAAQLGLRVVMVETHELNDEDYVANSVNRCYFCKDELFTRIDESVAKRHKLGVVVYGENADDSRRPDRPGGRAAREHEVLYPLGLAGATKRDVRALASAFDLISANKPAAPCLASRIPHGEPVTAEKLRAVDEAEDAVLSAGFSDCRVRHHGSIARIEVPVGEFGLLLDETRRHDLITAVKAAGFTHVTLDMNGIQSGAFSLSILNAGARRG